MTRLLTTSNNTGGAARPSRKTLALLIAIATWPARVTTDHARSLNSGEFNAALVAPFNSAEGRNLAAGMERQPGRSAAVAQFGRVGCRGETHCGHPLAAATQSQCGGLSFIIWRTNSMCPRKP